MDIGLAFGIFCRTLHPAREKIIRDFFPELDLATMSAPGRWELFFDLFCEFLPPPQIMDLCMGGAVSPDHLASAQRWRVQRGGPAGGDLLALLDAMAIDRLHRQYDAPAAPDGEQAAAADVGSDSGGGDVDEDIDDRDDDDDDDIDDGVVQVNLMPAVAGAAAMPIAPGAAFPVAAAVAAVPPPGAVPAVDPAVQPFLAAFAALSQATTTPFPGQWMSASHEAVTAAWRGQEVTDLTPPLRAMQITAAHVTALGGTLFPASPLQATAADKKRYKEILHTATLVTQMARYYELEHLCRATAPELGAVALQLARHTVGVAQRSLYNEVVLMSTPTATRPYLDLPAHSIHLNPVAQGRVAQAQAVARLFPAPTPASDSGASSSHKRKKEQGKNKWKPKPAAAPAAKVEPAAAAAPTPAADAAGKGGGKAGRPNNNNK